eukprot:GILJ01002641.1.p1 GENE.GILJ01002641.1~~GILJ01002641.1.p1  ORF type:complete len:125 (-),score=43.10 GILJ01002641.1:172-546(-)
MSKKLSRSNTMAKTAEEANSFLKGFSDTKRARPSYAAPARKPATGKKPAKKLARHHTIAAAKKDASDYFERVGTPSEKRTPKKDKEEAAEDKEAAEEKAEKKVEEKAEKKTASKGKKGAKKGGK